MQNNKAIKIRATAIIIHDDKILLIQRHKKKCEFYAFPGGTVEIGETPEDAIKREILEETSLRVNVIKQIYFGWITDALDEYFYLCEYIDGTPHLSHDAIERTRMTTDYDYTPIWISLCQLPILAIYPSDIIEQLIHDSKIGFNGPIKNFELIKTQQAFKSMFS